MTRAARHVPAPCPARPSAPGAPPRKAAAPAVMAAALAFSLAPSASAVADEVPPVPGPLASGSPQAPSAAARTDGWLQARSADPLSLEDLPDVRIAVGEELALTGAAHGGWGRLAYAWSIAPAPAGGEPAWEPVGSDGPQLSVRCAEAGRYTVRLKVADQLDGRASTSCTVVVNNPALPRSGDGGAAAAAAVLGVAAAAAGAARGAHRFGASRTRTRRKG